MSKIAALRRSGAALICLTLLISPTAASANPSDDDRRPWLRTMTGQFRDRDALMVQATADIAGFGGSYVDRDGTLHVWLIEPERGLPSGVAARIAGLSGVPARQRSAVASNVAIHQASYTFAQLKTWHDQMKDILAQPGVVGTGIDEKSNRLTVIVDGLDRAVVTKQIESFRVPSEAVDIIAGTPIKLTLRDGRRPLVGGPQIEFQIGPGGIATATCTLGFAAIRGGVEGFVTNSHCSRTRGAVDSGRYWQAFRPLFDNDQVGTETADRPMWTGGSCPTGRTCRLSDANFVDTHDGVAIGRGSLARPPFGTLNWNGTDLYRINAADFTEVDRTVLKVGRTTGLTAGVVWGTCFNTNVADSNHTMICQDIATYDSDSGDSGSPVFELTNSPLANDVKLVGINWGSGELSNGQQIAVLSPFPWVWFELGYEYGVDVLVCTSVYFC